MKGDTRDQAHNIIDAVHLAAPDLGNYLDGHLGRGVHYYPLIVQYEDTDAGGIVYHANYANFAERGRSAMLRALGIDLQDYMARDHEAIIIRKMNVDFIKPAKLNDRLVVVSHLTSLSGVRAQIDQQIFSLSEGHIFARVLVEGVWVNIDTGPKRFPLRLREALKSIIDA